MVRINSVMKYFLIPLLIALVISADILADVIKKPSKNTVAPASSNTMPKVDKPKTQKQKLDDCLSEKKIPTDICEKRFGKK